MGDLVTRGDAEEGECLRGCSEVREEAEEVFCVQFCAVKGPCDIHTALNVGSENGGID